MDVKQEREELIELAEKALKKIKDVIPMNMEDTEPEKLKIAVQGKLEAIEACKQIISTVEELKELNDEQDPGKDAEENSIFGGAEGFAK